MATISKNPPAFHELWQALDSLPLRNKEPDPGIPGISSREKSVLLVLASFYGSDARAFPSTERLTRKLALSSRESVRNILRSLKNKGYVWKEECFAVDETGKKRQTTNNWYFSEAILLLDQLKKLRRQLNEAEWEGAGEEEITRIREAIERTKASVMLVLDQDKKRSCGISERNGRLGYLAGKIRSCHKQLDSLQIQLRESGGQSPEAEGIRKLITSGQEKLYATETLRREILSTPVPRKSRIIRQGERRPLSTALKLVKKAEEVKPEPDCAPDPLPEVQEELTQTQKDPEPEAAKPPAKPAPRVDYTEIYGMWKEAGGRTLTFREKLKFSDLQMPLEEARTAMKKVLSSPFLFGRFRSLLWLPHIEKEELFDRKAKGKVGLHFYNAMFHDGKSFEEVLEKFEPVQGYDTLRGKIPVILKKDMISGWIKAWTDEAMEDRNKNERLKAASPPPVMEPDEIPF